ncbi:hypothetical protein ACNI65_00765 [Roseateles sp. So40a]|uniref:hypothetical protein n=1 Tax=Roseateles sp. So40a TaxID=3400226 RepID=UPI003A8B6220
MSHPQHLGPRRLLWSRWLVLAVLALTLPLQGALAATMGIGMALMGASGGQGGDVVTTMPTDCHEMAAMDMSAIGHDMTGMDHAVAQDAHDGHDAPSDASMDHASDHHCGICLQCCVGAAMLIAPLSLAAQDLRDAAPTLRALDAPEPAPQPFERPPKSFLA